MLNDRLDALAENFYNDSSLWRLIAVFNGITDPARNVGSKLINIPPLQQLVKFL